MEVIRKPRTTATEEVIKAMIMYRKEGRTYEYIAEKVGVHYTTVQKYVRNVSLENREVGKHKRDLVIRLLDEGKCVDDAAEIANATKDYIYKIIRSREVKKNKRKKEEVKKVKTDRQREIEKINKEINRQKKKEEKEWKKQLEVEKLYYKEKYNYAFN